MSVSGYKERIELNVISSDGTVIISHGDLTGSAAYTQKMTNKHNRPCLHVDLNLQAVFIASSKINTWIINNSIEVLIPHLISKNYISYLYIVPFT